MGLLERIADARSATKTWAGEPNFWETDALRWPVYAGATPEEERIEADYESYVCAGLKGNSLIAACVMRRKQVFSQARFKWLYLSGQMHGSPELALLEQPWPNGTSGELLGLMEIDGSFAGNAFLTKVDDDGHIGRGAVGPTRRIVRMRPDWTTIVIDAPSGNPYALDAKVVAYSYQPRAGYGSTVPEATVLLPSEVAHYSPLPDPLARFRGMSWITSVVRELQADSAATDHKLAFFRNGATPNIAIKFDVATNQADLDGFKAKFDEAHRGGRNAYKTLFLAGGADVTPLSVDFKQLDFKATQGAGETRIATAAGVPAAILGISEGLAGSSLNAGNFGAARRLFVDTTIRDLWDIVAPSLQVLLTPPLNTRLAVDGSSVPFLREDEKDRAEIQGQEALDIRTLLDAGCTFDSIIRAIPANDWTLLEHSGLFSVQLQAPGTSSPAPSLNGSANGQQAVPAR